MKMIALLRGINVGGNRKISMAALCDTATRAGLTKVKSYIQSGNLVFEAGKMNTEQASICLEKAIEKSFGFHVDVIVRTALRWAKYSDGNPFPAAARERPNLLLLGLCKSRCRKNLAAVLNEQATQGERIKLVDDAIWVDFAVSVGKSKLTPAAFDKAAGSTVTLRNWNTVLKLRELLTDETKSARFT